jgi:prefoldin alpha subunit
MSDRPQPTQVPLSALSLQQLVGIRREINDEVRQLTATIQLTNEAIAKAQKAREALATFSTCESGKEMLVPITGSMYVHGVVHAAKRPIIELGTGYFTETTIENANGHFTRKLSRLNGQHEALRNTLRETEQKLQIVQAIIAQKVQGQPAK